mmetsp:Transcript_7038/g.12556  ORF Transcript_7038/g.12556 Transcript_7038/m.12556 type:complete len:219 (+) Transcript_7038:535-1191(+)
MIARKLLNPVTDNECVTANCTVAPWIRSAKKCTFLYLCFVELNCFQRLEECCMRWLPHDWSLIQRSRNGVVKLIIEGEALSVWSVCRNPVLILCTSKELDKAAAAIGALRVGRCSYMEEYSTLEAEGVVLNVVWQSRGEGDSLTHHEAASSESSALLRYVSVTGIRSAVCTSLSIDFPGPFSAATAVTTATPPTPLARAGCLRGASLGSLRSIPREGC